MAPELKHFVGMILCKLLVIDILSGVNGDSLLITSDSSSILKMLCFHPLKCVGKRITSLENSCSKFF